jgi:Zn-dependent membrane protease YugP
VYGFVYAFLAFRSHRYPQAKAAGNGAAVVNFESINVHAANLLMIGTEVLLDNIVLVKAHVVFVVLFAASAHAVLHM